MSDANTSVFTSIILFFQTFWTSFLGLFHRADQAPVDVEAGISPGPGSRTVSELEKGLPVNNLVDAIDKISHSVPSDDGFVEVELHAVPQSVVRSNNEVKQSSNRTSVNYDHPSRRPSRRESAVDPMKARVLEDTFKHVQDKTLDVVKQVVITPGTTFPTAFSAQIEYYDAPIVQACEAKIEYCTAPAVEACSAQVEYYDASVVESPGVEAEMSFFTAVDPSYAEVNPHSEEPAKTVVCIEDEAEVVADPSAQESIERTDSELDEIEYYINQLEETLVSFRTPLRTRPPSPAFTMPPAIKSETATPRLKKKHRVQFAMYPQEVPYSRQPEKASAKHRERKSKKRADLFDVIAQFPDIPAFVPTCPPGRVSPGTQIPEAVSHKYAFRSADRRHSGASCSSDASTSSYGSGSSASTASGAGSDYTEQTSAPGTPEAAGSAMMAEQSSCAAQSTLPSRRRERASLAMSESPDSQGMMGNILSRLEASSCESFDV
ncbi:hypothetical protein D9613_009192 [Agrocybe pediades]|uniref:Uncharacterized protein n=1 Tax=Agrocybe pediades TaxID=84607 RepID=A0A8H4R3Q6_9AGAR|nr:hypothetical protein D9613_009192 [Agrocybe pediades]